jgi:ParB family chromosome partitioning protein
MMGKLSIDLIEDFPVISKLYKENFNKSDSHLLIGPRIVPKTYIEELAKSIEQEGLHHPILVRKQPYDSYQIISGHLRKYAFKKLAKKTIPVKVIEVDDLQAKAMLITTNRFQHSLEQIEEAWVVQDLIENHNRSLKECAVTLNVSKTWVYHRYLLATKLIKEIQLDIVMGLISPRSATEIATVHAREQQGIVRAVKQRRLSFRETSALIQIIKDENIPVRIKELALDDPRMVIQKVSRNETISYYSGSRLSYFANNFREETNRLLSVSLELIHRIRRDFAGFSEFERQILLKDLTIVTRRINELSNLLKEVGVNGKEFNQ